MSEVAAAMQEALNAAMQSQSNQMHTAIPCIVVAVRDSLQGAMVDIQPTINQRFKDSTSKERPVILGVPVSFPVSLDAGLTFPVRIGTTGMAVFSMRNMDAWKSGNGRPATPLNFAKFDKGDAMFIPGIQPPGVSVNNPAKRTWTHSTEDCVLVNNIGKATECEVRLKSSGDIVINTNQNVEVNCKDATVTTTGSATIDVGTNFSVSAATATFDIGSTTWTGSIQHNGGYSGNGAYTFNGINFNSHKHTGVQSGISTSGGPTN